MYDTVVLHSVKGHGDVQENDTSLYDVLESCASVFQQSKLLLVGSVFRPIRNDSLRNEAPFFRVLHISFLD